MIVSLISGEVGIGGTAEGDELTSIENLTGSIFGDTLTGNSSANVLNGNNGAGSRSTDVRQERSS